MKRIVLILCSFATIVILAGSAVPDVNESHYLVKARHWWDPDFAPRDLFVQSHDSHLLANVTLGVLTLGVSLYWVAWIGRVIAWLFIAIAWQRLTSAIGLRPWCAGLGLAGWYLGCHYGHWSGEWFLGGIEAKSIAYPFVVLALAAVANRQWGRGWAWIGAAIAWHPIVGGWAGVTYLVAHWWDTRAEFLRSLWRQRMVLTVAMTLALLGIIPALGGLFSPNREGPYVASQVHVYFRLAHHLCPRLFDPVRHLAAGTTLAVFAGLSWLAWQASGRDCPLWQRIAPLLRISWGAVGIALFGLAVDLLLSDVRLPTYQPEIASQILRFYWFRWADVAVPLGVMLSLGYLAAVQWPHVTVTADRPHAVPASGVQDEPLIRTAPENWKKHAASITVVAGTTAIVLGTAYRTWENFSHTIPPAERLVARAPGSDELDPERLIDWLAVCAWIRENTPHDALWLTPKHQQTFKWHTGASEVVCWKDVPQDNASAIEWFRRIQRCRPPRDAHGNLRGWTTEELIALASEYDAPWILVDRSIQTEPPLLEIRYPIDIENKSFAVFYVDPVFIERYRAQHGDDQ